MRYIGSPGFLAFTLTMASAMFAVPYQQHLASESVRNAYFLGRRMDQKTGDFLARYTQSLPLPKTGPHIGRIQVLTPYAQVVLRATQDQGVGTVSDAEQEYDASPNLFVVRIDMYSTPTYSLPALCEDLVREFSMRAVQQHLLKPLKTTCAHLYAVPHSSPTNGTEIDLQFDVAQIASAPITIEVSSPGGPQVEAKFDLDKLK